MTQLLYGHSRFILLLDCRYIISLRRSAPPFRSHDCCSFFLFFLAEVPPSGMSKNGYFFQEMGEFGPELSHIRFHQDAKPT